MVYAQMWKRKIRCDRRTNKRTHKRREHERLLWLCLEFQFDQMGHWVSPWVTYGTFASLGFGLQGNGSVYIYWLSLIQSPVGGHHDVHFFYIHLGFFLSNHLCEYKILEFLLIKLHETNKHREFCELICINQKVKSTSVFQDFHYQLCASFQSNHS